MNPTFDAFVRSWPFEPWIFFSLLLTLAVYLNGWIVLHERDQARWPTWRPLAFLGGITAIFLALASPIDPFASFSLQIHMVQHLLLMMAAPPLLWLGAPFFPMMRGLPRPIRSYWIAPLFRLRWLRRCVEFLTHPVPALLLFTAATWAWHVPMVYELALRSPGLHHLQHFSFLITALIFWYPVIRPYPSRPRWSPWILIPYLVLADVQNTLLSAVLTFSDRPLYPFYVTGPRLGNLSPVEDQAAAGVLMWVPGSAVFLAPLFWIGIQLLYGARRFPGERRSVSPTSDSDKVTGRQGDKVKSHSTRATRIPLPISQLPGSSVTLSPGHPVTLSLWRFDLLRLPVLGRFLRWRHARLGMQLVLLVIASMVILDGLTGPQVGPMNLAGVLPWIHWRGFVILGLLSAGNLFCMACPFMLPRTVARRWLPQGWNWPRRLRSKWLAVALLTLFLWAYEAFSLWDSPWWTAWITLGYFAAALVIDGFFRGAAFCKYVCPIGQFNFVQSLISPMEVRVRDPEVCSRCHTKDCIRGRDNVPGCELALFQPRKAGNLDCTYCLDCIHACPHDNVGILAGAPGRELWRDPLRSGIGRLSKRPDLAALVLVLVFGAFANAAGMVGPLLELRDQLEAWSGLSPILTVSLFYAVALVILPIILIAGAAGLARWLGKLSGSWLTTSVHFSYALVPIGFSMWLAHYSFHFLGSFESAWPVAQRFVADLGWNGLGAPQWACACCRPVADWLPRLEITFLDLGLLLSLYTGFRIALLESRNMSQALRALAPWTMLLVLLFALGVWIVLQPMQMRGSLMMAG